MSGTNLARFGAVVAGDLISLLVPGGGTLSYVANAVIERRQREGAQALIEELSAGLHGPVVFEELDVEPVVAMSLRISRAIRDGTSMRNIRFLAQVVAGLKKKKSLTEDSFLKWAKIVEGLTRDELLLLGIAYRIHMEISEERFRERFEKACSEADFSAAERVFISSAISRTGLLVPTAAWGGNVYEPSPLLEELGSLINLANGPD